ncbi:MAG: hypothetical protein DMF63_00965 [Acidobacteria bacterium]|nr:MAG: hypothetical protein DMF63_00965 [Acidobacteriota bacterium]
MKLLLIIALATLTFFAFSFRSVTFTAVEAQNNVLATYENYDIRTDPGATAKLAEFRSGGHTSSIDATSSKFKLEYNESLGVVEILDPINFAHPLINTDKNLRARTLENFVSDNANLFGIRSLTQLKKTADYTNPDGNLSFVRYEQWIGEIPVFGAEIKAGFSKRNEMFRIINTLAPDVDSSKLLTEFGSAENAIKIAASHIGIIPEDIKRNESPRPGVFEFTSPSFTDKVTAEKFYFPVGNGIVRPSWRVLLWTGESSFYVVVDVDGTLLWRKNLTEHQTVGSTYNVYGNNFTSLLKTADSPSPFTPGCLSPIGCPQPAAVARTNFTLIGNEAPYTFNNLGWIPDTGLPVRTPADPNITDGNNVESGIDRVPPDGIDPNGWARTTGMPSRVFSYTYNPAPGIPPPGEEPLGGTGTPSQFQQGVATHGFYLINRWHDEMYRFGFTEQAGNFQHFNFGRGGVEGDRVSLEVQDISGTNGSTVTIAADGNRARIQTFIWTGPTPDRDGALDSHVTTHEMTHGLSLRLIGNSTGLTSNMSRGMGEGWGDFYALALLSEPSDDPLGTHALAGYTSYQLSGTESNYYYGIRRFPLAVLRSVGPNGLPHNPLTFRYLNNTCDTFIGTTTTNPSSAYPRNPVVATSGSCDQIHNMGEVWAAALWEVRDQLIQRRGSIEGNRRAIQYITDAMKLSPLNPTILQMRDSILVAATVSDSTDVGAVWRGFAIRGMGLSAMITNPGTGTNNTVVTEAFDLPQQYRRPPRADFDGDGKSDVSVFRPSDRNWYMNRSTTGFAAVTWGLSTDKPIVDDFDGDGKADFTVFRATADGSMPDYYTLLSSTSTVSYLSWGIPGDIPLTDDFDGDNKADHTIFRPSTGQFWVRRSTDGSALTSTSVIGGVPLAGDLDGDGRGDFATYTDGFWRILRSETEYTPGFLIHWGTTGDKVVNADYDGDGKDDLAVYRPSNGTWYISGSAVGTRIVTFGISTDIPVPADYDGDARADVAVYRDGIWYINRSTGGVLITSFGLAGDTPLPATFVP